MVTLHNNCERSASMEAIITPGISTEDFLRLLAPERAARAKEIISDIKDPRVNQFFLEHPDVVLPEADSIDPIIHSGVLEYFKKESNGRFSPYNLALALGLSPTPDNQFQSLITAEEVIDALKILKHKSVKKSLSDKNMPINVSNIVYVEEPLTKYVIDQIRDTLKGTKLKGRDKRYYIVQEILKEKLGAKYSATITERVLKELGKLCLTTQAQYGWDFDKTREVLVRELPPKLEVVMVPVNDVSEVLENVNDHQPEEIDGKSILEQEKKEGDEGSMPKKNVKKTVVKKKRHSKIVSLPLSEFLAYEIIVQLVRDRGEGISSGYFKEQATKLAQIQPSYASYLLSTLKKKEVLLYDEESKEYTPNPEIEVIKNPEKKPSRKPQVKAKVVRMKKPKKTKFKAKVKKSTKLTSIKGSVDTYYVKAMMIIHEEMADAHTKIARRLKKLSA